MIQVSINANKAWCDQRELLTTGSVGAEVNLRFSAEWDDLQAFAVFRAYDRSEAAPVAGDSIEIPATMLEKAGVHLLLGVYGVSEDGKVVIPTVYADLGEIHAGANLTGADNYVPPETALIAQILALAKAAQSAAATAVSGTYAGSVTFEIDDDGHMIMTVTEDGDATETDLGPVSAYAAAVEAGYTGTYAEFQALLTANARTEYDVDAALAAVEDVTSTASAAQTAAEAAQTAAAAAQTAATAAQTAVSGKQAQHKTAQVTLSSGATSWPNLSVTGVTATNTVICTPAPASNAAWVLAGVYCSAQGSGTLSFASAATTTEAITVNVLIFD